MKGGIIFISLLKSSNDIIESEFSCEAMDFTILEEYDAIPYIQWGKENSHGPWEDRLTSSDLTDSLWCQVSHHTILLTAWDYKCLGDNNVKQKGRDFGKNKDTKL